MKNSEIIQGTIDLLEMREQWTRCAAARTEPDGTDRYANWRKEHGENAGTVTKPLDDRAQSWCLGGAMLKVTGWNDWKYLPKGVNAIFLRLARERGWTNWMEMNNDKSIQHEDLMLFLKEALYDARATEAKAAIKANLAAVEVVL